MLTRWTVLPAIYTFIYKWNESSCLYSPAAKHHRSSAGSRDRTMQLGTHVDEGGLPETVSVSVGSGLGRPAAAADTSPRDPSDDCRRPMTSSTIMASACR